VAFWKVNYEKFVVIDNSNNFIPIQSLK